MKSDLTFKDLQTAIENLRIHEDYKSEIRIKKVNALYENDKVYKLKGELLVSGSLYNDLQSDFEGVMKRDIKIIDLDWYFKQAEKESKPDEFSDPRYKDWPSAIQF